MVVGFRYYLYRCRQLLYYHSWPKVREGGLVWVLRPRSVVQEDRKWRGSPLRSGIGVVVLYTNFNNQIQEATIVFIKSFIV